MCQEGSLKRGFAIVLDIGKTLSKVTLWSRDGHLLDRQIRPNAECRAGGIRRLDAEGIGAWIVETLSAHSGQPVEVIVPVAHGAGVAAIRDDALAFPPLDYEQAIPADILAEYRALRDAFARTGSPALPNGLNMGSQLFWLNRLYPDLMPQMTFLPWAQYWAWFLSGVAASEVTSLGCHSDLWAPDEGTFSPLAQRFGWADRFAGLVRAADPVGTLRPELAARTGLPPTVKVLAGLHDSNAAVLAARGFVEIALEEATILSTGTWFIGMRLSREVVLTRSLPERRDCLVNIDADGRPVPSVRFMGGREIETVIGSDTRRVDIKPDQPALVEVVPGLLDSQSMLLPTLAPGTGPFPESRSRWLGEPQDRYARRAAACLYAALMADASLDLIGSKERILVEGRFAEAEVFVRALAALRPETTVYTATAHNDVSFGALRLIDSSLRPQGALKVVAPFDGDLESYRTRWRTELERVA